MVEISMASLIISLDYLRHIFLEGFAGRGLLSWLRVSRRMEANQLKNRQDDIKSNLCLDSAESIYSTIEDYLRY